MKKKLVSVAITASIILSPCAGLAATNYARYDSQGQYEYPIPVNSYETQGYDYEDDYNLPYTFNPNNNSSYNNNKKANNPTQNDNKYQGRVIYVPAKTVFSATVSQAVSSENARVGDSISLYLPSDFYYNNELIAPAGSRIQGTVLKVGRGTYGNKNGKLQIRFTQMVTPNGQQIPMTARIETADGTGILKAGTIKDSGATYARNVVAGAAAGALMGLISGAIYGGVGKGTVAGTASGGAMGLVGAVMEKGGNVEIPQGAQINIVLDQPLTLAPNNSYR